MPPPTPPSRSAIHNQTALRLVAAVVRAGFDSTDDVLRLARRFDIFGQMHQHEPIDATCSEFAEKLLAYRGELGPGFFEELYQQATSLSWATIRGLTRTIAGVELASEAPPREHPELLAQIRIELDAPALTPAEGKALLARLEALFPAPTIRTFRFEQREHSVHALLCLPASAARTLRKRGPRGLSQETRRPIRRVVETSSPFILAWTMGSWWLREHDWTLIFLPPVAVAATLLAQPAPHPLITPSITHADMLVAQAERDTSIQQRDTVILERDDLTRELDAVAIERNALLQALEACRNAEPDPITTAALAACQTTAVECRVTTKDLGTKLTTCMQNQAEKDALLGACELTKDELGSCKAAAKLDAIELQKALNDNAQLKALAKLNPNGRCPLPKNWTSRRAVLRGTPVCDNGGCTVALDPEGTLTWLTNAQILGPPGSPQAKELRKGDSVCAEGLTTEKFQFQTQRLVALPR